MTKTIKFTEKQLSKAKRLRDEHKNEREYRAALVFLFIAENKHSAEEAASMFGIGLRTVFEDLDKIRKPKTRKSGIWGGGNNHLMSFEEETQFLLEFEKKAKAGKHLSMPDIHNLYNLRIGKKTPKSTFYRLLKRHNWRKVPRDPLSYKEERTVTGRRKKRQTKWKWQKLT